MNKKTIALLMGLCIFGLLFIIPIIPKIWHEFRLPQFFLHPFFSVLTLFILGVFLHFSLEKYKKSDFIFIADALIAVSLIGMLLELPHISEFYQHSIKTTIQEAISSNNKTIDVSGDWIYEVRDMQNNITQSGESIINQDGNEASIKGKRTHTVLNGKLIALQEGIPWSTEFGLIQGKLDPKFYFVYFINVKASGTTRGYCVLKIDRSANEMYGDYAQIAPNTLQGHVIFRKKGHKEAGLN